MLAEFPLEIRQAGRPIEVEVALSGETYLAFYSFASTALFTLKKIFPEIRVFQIDDAHWARGYPITRKYGVCSGASVWKRRSSGDHESSKRAGRSRVHNPAYLLKVTCA